MAASDGASGVHLQEWTRKVATIWFDRPAAMNALDIAALRSLAAIIDALETEDRYKVVVLAGKGKGFCSGNDLKARMTPAEANEAQALGRRACLKLMHLPQITVAAVHGFAVGGGFEIALAADLRVASENARFGLPELKLGMPVAWGGWNLLAKLVGIPKAKEVLLLGELFGAREAMAAGLVSKIFPDAGFLDATLDLARELRKRDAHAVQLAMLAANHVPDLPLGAAEGLAGEIFSILSLPPDQRAAGIKALRGRLAGALLDP